MPSISNLADYGMIANSVKDDVLTPNESGIQRQQLKSLALGNQGQEMKLGMAQKQMDTDALIKQSIQKNSAVDPSTGQVKINHGQVAADLANAGHADKAYKYMDTQHKSVYEKHAGEIEQLARQARRPVQRPRTGRFLRRRHCGAGVVAAGKLSGQEGREVLAGGVDGRTLPPG